MLSRTLAGHLYHPKGGVGAGAGADTTPNNIFVCIMTGRVGLALGFDFT